MAALCNMFTALFPLLFTHFVSFKPPYGGGTILVKLHDNSTVSTSKKKTRDFQPLKALNT